MELEQLDTSGQPGAIDATRCARAARCIRAAKNTRMARSPRTARCADAAKRASAVKCNSAAWCIKAARCTGEQCGSAGFSVLSPHWAFPEEKLLFALQEGRSFVQVAGTRVNLDHFYKHGAQVFQEPLGGQGQNAGSWYN